MDSSWLQQFDVAAAEPWALFCDVPEPGRTRFRSTDLHYTVRNNKAMVFTCTDKAPPPSEILATLRSLGAESVMWWLGASSHPTIAAQLLDLGFTRRAPTVDFMPMALRSPATSEPRSRTVPGLAIVEVTDDLTLDTRVQVELAACNDEEWTRDDTTELSERSASFRLYYEAYKQASYGPHLNPSVESPAVWRHYMATMDGDVPVGSASISLMAFPDGDESDESPKSRTIAFISAVAVVPSRRRRGIGAALTWHCVTEAMRAGSCVVGLSPYEDGLGMYHALGFSKAFDIDVFDLRNL